ncbi:Bacterial regulatory proteins, tetR family [Sphingobacterium spiritivorum]|uniref:Transcriptional regulator, TetR family n=2 Tax=Sphingobacterium spiritivorum TaxID=258 RepID=D7VRP6_SPHSI|nr:transcriptional regulator, TetR family [Sphingobacterium spiritivorum ATCC 33861]QQT35483.1 TetR/AcrR family transcriptional regulator [Sphingobacterium spiritivorum]SUJ06307.1 Bacterial regulatory proteins, tetR family [Sphingobacterium spiritivorum]
MDMDTRSAILTLADKLIREKGFNAFSFSDIARQLNIRNASIHYHFPTKTALGVAVIDYHIDNFKKTKHNSANLSALEKLETFFGIHAQIQLEKRVCIVGSLAPDYHTLEDCMTDRLKEFSSVMLDWVTGFLEEGKQSGVFNMNTDVRTKALLIISNMIAIVPLARLTDKNDFKLIKEAIKKELLLK